MLDVIIGKGKIKDKKTNLFHSVKDKTDFNLKRFTGRKAGTFKAKSDLRHSCSLQEIVFSVRPNPLQSFPPLDGGGLVQVLVSVCMPPPQVTLHSEIDQSV